MFKYGRRHYAKDGNKMKFTINKVTHVRKAYDENDKCVAVFGFVQDLLDCGILEYAAKGTEHKVVVVYTDYSLKEYDTIEEAKQALSK